jgi:hypothetical protein
MLLETVSGFKKARNSAHSRSISRLETLQDLLDAIGPGKPEETNLIRMLSATAGHISMTLGQPPGKISIRQLLEIRPRLRLRLREKGFRRNSYRSYSNFVRILLAKARELGWFECSPEVEGAWEQIRGVTVKKLGCSRIILYAVRNGLIPSEFTEVHIANWRAAAIEDGRSAGYLADSTARFRKAVREAGLTSLLPQLVFSEHDEMFYGLPLSRFPEPLRTQVLEMLSWKTAEFSPGRPRRAKNRPISAKCLRWVLSRMVGFIVKIKGGTVTSLQELLSRKPSRHMRSGV